MHDELAELKARYERLRLLYQVATVIHSTLDPQEALQLIVREAVSITGASSGSVVLLNPTTALIEILAAQGLPEAAAELKLRVGEGITGWVARTGKAARIDNVTADPRYVMVRGDVRSELAVPLEVNGEVRGVLNVDSDRLAAFSADDQELLTALAAHAARVIQNLWLVEQLRLKARLLESLASVSRTINSTLSLDEALTVITREACGLMQAKVCSLMMIDASQSWLDVRASHGAGEAYLNKPRLSLPESLIGGVVRRKKPAQVEDVRTSSRYQSVEVARMEGLVSLLSVPLIFNQEAVGALNIYKSQRYTFSNEEIRILTAFAELSAIAIEKAQLYEQVMDVEEQLRRNEKLSALGLLAAEVAHEIRNPLTVMKMLYHSLELKFPETDPRAQDVRVMEEKFQQMNRIVERILDFARNAEPEFSPVNLNELIEELGLLVRHKFGHQNIQLRCELQPEMPTVQGDAAQLEQAFLNLLLNAAEAMPGGGIITVRTFSVIGAPEVENRSAVVVEFEDTGTGMTEEQRARAFNSFLTTTKAKGTGLGLAIVGRIIEAHRGTAAILPCQHGGTRIRLCLPV